MNNLKSIKTFTLILLTFLLHQVYGQKLKFEIFNETGYNLDSLSFGYSYIGTLKKGASIIVKDCENFTLNSEIFRTNTDSTYWEQLPYLRPEAVIKNKIKNITMRAVTRFKKCVYVTKGHYKFDITLSENEFGYRLYWTKHY